MLRHLFAFLMLILFVGCGSDGYELAPVSGRVLVDGEPVKGLRIAFEPIGGSGRPAPGPEAIAITDDDGNFKLATMSESPRRGAVIGPCRVRIWTLPSSQPDAVFDDRDPNYDPVAEIKAIKAGLRKKKSERPKSALPLKYNDKTDLTFEVTKDGTDKANFDISWKE